MIWVNAMKSWSQKTDKYVSTEREQMIGLKRELWKNINRMGVWGLFLAWSPTSVLVLENVDLKVTGGEEKGVTKFADSGISEGQ